MNKVDVPTSWQSSGLHAKSASNTVLFLGDIAKLVKAPVLIANVLPVFVGFWLALYMTNTSFLEHTATLLLLLTGSTSVMAGALVINNWFDADIDKVMARTQKRPTVTGNISLKATLYIGIILSVLGFLLLLFTTLEATLYAFIGWFTYVILYTMWSKRKYTLNTVVGSVSGAVTPLIGWATIESTSHIVPIILFCILFIWQMPHTFAIAIRKYNEYQAAKVAMLPVVYGINITKRQIFIYVACLLPLPFYLSDLGTSFIVFSTILNVAWLGLCIYGFFTKNIAKWAKIQFLYSVNYIMFVFLIMIIVTLPTWN
ncbi:heme o synthase [Evansella sp. AB-rgal1]|uniref:heme o synthase n=1 Tax=Evansella sp. AB-rgal1 TaxID=3242696 RepID=UPI00359CCF1E